MGIKRRAFLIGGGAIVGAGLFGLFAADRSARNTALDLTRADKAGSYTAWLRIGEDGQITLFTPHIDMGTGSATAFALLAAEELDAALDQVTVAQAPVDYAMANSWLARGFVGEMGSPALQGLPDALFSLMARNIVHQITGGSSAVRFFGMDAVRTMAAAARQALIEEAAERLKAPFAELTTANGEVLHKASSRKLGYGELAIAAAGRSLSDTPRLKPAKDYSLVGKPAQRRDIPGKVDGSAKYGIDFALPGMKVATVMAAPVFGGKLEAVDPAPAMAVKGVEQVIRLDDAVAVIANGYWPALKGLRALQPRFSDGGKGAVTSASLLAEQDKLIAADAPQADAGDGKLIEATYRTPFLHHAMMETFALTAHLRDGKLDLWGGMQDPLSTRIEAAEAAGLPLEAVTFHPMLLGGGFGRKLPGATPIIAQTVRLAKEVNGPVKLIWPREEEVAQGAYRPMSTIAIKAVVGKDGKLAAWHSAHAQPGGTDDGGPLPYAIASIEREHLKHDYHVPTSYWRSVNSSQHGFYNESFMDELAHAAGADPLAFRLAHLAPDSRAARTLKEAARMAGWGTPLPKGSGRGIAVVDSFGTCVAHVIQASLREDGTPRAEKVWSAVDCGQVVDPVNAEAQVMGAIVMGLSAAIHEEITIDKGAVVQTSYSDYPLLTLAEAPEIAITFLASDSPVGGLGEPGLPPVAPALANALFAATGKRVRQLPIRNQAAVSA